MRRSIVPALFLAAAVLPAQDAPRAQLAAKFRDQLTAIARTTNGVVGISVLDLVSGERFGVNDRIVFPQGSAIKIPILIELFRAADAGTMRLDERLPVRAADQAAGSGIAQHFADGQSALALHDLAVLMIVLSDNTATNLLIDRLGMDRINRTTAELGATSVQLQRRMIRPLDSAQGRENLASPADAVEVMRRIHQCELPMTRPSCERLRRILEIPKAGELPASTPELRVAWKPGSVEGVETAWGLVALPGNPYALAVMVNWSDADAAGAAIRAVADATRDYFRRITRGSAWGVRVPLPLVDSIRRKP